MSAAPKSTIAIHSALFAPRPQTYSTYLSSPLPSRPQSTPTLLPPSPDHTSQLRPDLPPAKRARVARYKNYVPEEETIRNDYSQQYVDGGDWPQNWVLGAEPEHRFEEYPKQQRLLNLKKMSVNNHSVAPAYLPFSQLHSLQPAKFDVILIDPPFSSSFTWDHLEQLPIPSLSADPSFLFLWVGSGAGDGLERGRDVLAKFGFRRCEDVVWVKTNKTTNRGPGTDPPTSSLLTRTKQHCLIGIRGTVRRSTDSWFVHCNVDTDVIFWEGDPTDPTRKPPEMYTLIENFCLGTRRLELFGRMPSSLRRGWVTALSPGQETRLPDGDSVYTDEGAVAGPWNHTAWDADIKTLANGGKFVVPMTAEIDTLRPKSPVRSGPPGGGRGGHSQSTNGARFMAEQHMGQGLPLNPMMMPQPQMLGMANMGMNGMGDASMMQWPAMLGAMGGMLPPAMGYGFGGAWGQQHGQYMDGGGWDDGSGAAMQGMNMGMGMMPQQQWGNANGGRY
ncbi:hypothetical protein MKEN_01128000 [Mycena kentingensis (nom. inval.)]|nr:hypothetical protein MKEN_01128000 [Mycena kentingensis (nom. inval.)]